MNRKLLIVLLVVLVVLFVVAIGVGAAGRPEPAGNNLNWIESLGNKLAPEKALKAGDISAAIPEECRQLLTAGRVDMPASSTWILLIGESRAPVRTLALRRVEGDVTVTLDSFTEKRPTARLAPDKDTWPELQVFKEGGELRVECGMAPCTIERAK